MDRKKEIPEFTSEAEEREFWAKVDSTEYLDWKQGKHRQFPELEPSADSTLQRLLQSLNEDK